MLSKILSQSVTHTELKEICLIPNACSDFTRRNRTNECSTGTWLDRVEQGNVSWCGCWCARWGFVASIRSHFTPPLAYAEICFGSKARRAATTMRCDAMRCDAGADKDMTNFTHLPRTRVDVASGLTRRCLKEIFQNQKKYIYKIKEFEKPIMKSRLQSANRPRQGWTGRTGRAQDSLINRNRFVGLTCTTWRK